MSVKSPLPKGRHGLSREEVASSQRTRLLKATVELGTTRGFASLTLADIVSAAGVARSTFYEQFADKEECSLAAYDYAAQRVLERVLAIGPPPEGDFASPIHAYIATMLDLALEEPGLVRLVTADADALGPKAGERQRELRVRIADGHVALREHWRRTHPELPPITRLRALAIVGAFSEVIQYTLSTDGVDALRALEPELVTVMHALLETP